MLKNIFGLVYADAITKNQTGEVQITSVSYPNSIGLNLAANLYTPKDFDQSKTYPAIVVAHPNGGVKEQVSGLFAQILAEAGFVTVAFDAAYQGASGGFPRQTDRPASRVDDIRSSIDYLLKQPFVDADRIGALGICGGGGYTIEVAKMDKRIKAIATISMFNSGRVRRNGFKDEQVSTIQDRLKQAASARSHYAKTGAIDYLGELATQQVHFSDEALTQIPAGLYRDGAQYYGDTHYHPNAQSRYTTMSLMDLMAWDAENQVELIDQPLLMIAGDISDTRYMTDAVYEKATGTTDKKLVLIPGANHIETYWKPEYVKQEKKSAIDFFSDKL